MSVLNTNRMHTLWYSTEKFSFFKINISSSFFGLLLQKSKLWNLSFKQDCSVQPHQSHKSWFHAQKELHWTKLCPYHPTPSPHCYYDPPFSLLSLHRATIPFSAPRQESTKLPAPQDIYSRQDKYCLRFHWMFILLTSFLQLRNQLNNFQELICALIRWSATEEIVIGKEVLTSFADNLLECFTKTPSLSSWSLIILITCQSPRHCWRCLELL